MFDAELLDQPRLRAWLHEGMPKPGQPTPPSSGDGVPEWPGRLLAYQPGQAMMRGHDVTVWQRQMHARGWRIDVDGVYEPRSAEVARLFQKEKGLPADGVVGRQTSEAAWAAPVT